MSLFPRFTQEFSSPLFRLLDDYDRVSRDTQHGGRHIRAWAPKFDVRERGDAYELHGELPGIDQKQINIEWSDSNTLTISGHVESRYELGEPVGDQEDNKHEYHKPTIEEEPEEGASTDRTTEKPADETTVATTNQNKEVAQPTKQNFKYWVSERSVGEFHRAFSFPGRVDPDGVTATLKNGILNITVPKATKPQARRINIE